MALLRVGDPAPDFSAQTHQGETIRLSDYVGSRALVLFFYPKDGTPVCTQEACSFRDSYEKFQAAGAEVLGVSGDSDRRHQDFAIQHELPFPLISDSEGNLRKAFGVRKKLGLIPERVTFVIDKQGCIRLVFAALFASDAHVQQALDALQATASS